MGKNLVYSWRLDPDLKLSLEMAARDHDTSIAALLEEIVTDWLEHQKGPGDDEAIQAKLHKQAAKYAGKIRGNDPHRTENARDNIRKQLMRKRAS